MAIEKKSVKSKPTISKVTFSLPAEAVNGAKKVALVGSFNDWKPEASPLKSQKDGSYKITLELPLGQEYAFRYLVDDETWINDPEADKYIASGVSLDENSVVVL
ncbi:isoamylase early set domain-containing protein [Tellurirhabdus bombi]|uniref:isoamylase early set domain-containing protein n=1 Tax=Tellurirhabdus bombi TaxID=2907205 RepID=UPI001F3DCEFC|nr:isoamylase early set domain-containing protein [Tellurirhabdus bombi]